MATFSRKLDEKTALAVGVSSLLAALGAGRVDGVAYDTAWVARLAPLYPQYGFDEALTWLRQHQYEDGSWGAPLTHYHDRYISTLAAIVALREVGNDSRDERRVKRGEDALWKLVGRLGMDDSDTVGFPILSAALSEEATALGLDVPRPPTRYAGAYKKKVSALLSQPERNWRASTLTFSLEALRAALNGSDDVLEANCSVSISPAATAAYLMTQEDEFALAYLRDAMAQDGVGAVPALAPIDIFEIVWTLNHLRLAGAITPDEPEVRRALDYLWSIWSPTTGVGHSSYFSVPDVDDTAACFSALRWGGYPVSADVFAYYELDDHFCCYHHETNPSHSAHVRLLAALRSCEDHPRYVPWVEKIVRALQYFDENGSFWWDKWHASPYYVTSTAVNALYGVADELARSRLRWILRTQNDDGGWGYLGQSTPEETAYCLQALLVWDQTVERIDSIILDDAARFLSRHVDDPYYAPLWISKGLYTPHYPVKAAILGALYSYMNRDR